MIFEGRFRTTRRRGRIINSSQRSSNRCSALIDIIDWELDLCQGRAVSFNRRTIIERFRHYEFTIFLNGPLTIFWSCVQSLYVRFCSESHVLTLALQLNEFQRLGQLLDVVETGQGRKKCSWLYIEAIQSARIETWIMGCTVWCYSDATIKRTWLQIGYSSLTFQQNKNLLYLAWNKSIIGYMELLEKTNFCGQRECLKQNTILVVSWSNGASLITHMLPIWC